VQGKINKRMKNKRRKLDADSFTIANIVKEFSKGVKEIEKNEDEDDQKDCNTCASE
jgi:hypothetical protein